MLAPKPFQVDIIEKCEVSSKPQVIFFAGEKHFCSGIKSKDVVEIKVYDWVKLKLFHNLAHLKV